MLSSADGTISDKIKETGAFLISLILLSSLLFVQDAPPEIPKDSFYFVEDNIDVYKMHDGKTSITSFKGHTLFRIGEISVFDFNGEAVDSYEVFPYVKKGLTRVETNTSFFIPFDKLDSLTPADEKTDSDGNLQVIDPFKNDVVEKVFDFQAKPFKKPYCDVPPPPSTTEPIFKAATEPATRPAAKDGDNPKEGDASKSQPLTNPPTSTQPAKTHSVATEPAATQPIKTLPQPARPVAPLPAPVQPVTRPVDDARLKRAAEYEADLAVDLKWMGKALDKIVQKDDPEKTYLGRAQITSGLEGKALRDALDANQKLFRIRAKVIGDLFLQMKTDLSEARANRLIVALTLYGEYRGRSDNAVSHLFYAEVTMENRAVSKNSRMRTINQNLGDFGNWLKGKPAVAALSNRQYSSWNLLESNATDRNLITMLSAADEMAKSPQSWSSQSLRKIFHFVSGNEPDIERYKVVSKTDDATKITHYISIGAYVPRGYHLVSVDDNKGRILVANKKGKQLSIPLPKWYRLAKKMVLPPVVDIDAAANDPEKISNVDPVKIRGVIAK